MIFETFGPFEIPRRENGLVLQNQGDFWRDVERKHGGLSEACGCYIFATKASGGSAPRPWYVGQTSKRTFREECFDHQKVLHYSHVLADYERVRPIIFLTARKTKAGRFSKPSRTGHRDICKLEEMLIGMAYWRNKGLLNIRGIRYLRDMVVPGLINSPTGNPGKAACELKKSLGLS